MVILKRNGVEVRRTDEPEVVPTDVPPTNPKPKKKPKLVPKERSHWIVSYFSSPSNLDKVKTSYRGAVKQIAEKGRRMKLTPAEYALLVKVKHYIDGNWRALKSPKWNK